MLAHRPKRSTARALWMAMAAVALCACATQAPQPVSTAPVDRPDDTEVPAPADVPPSSGRTQAADTLLASAREAAAQNRHRDAVVYLERAIRLDPRNTQLWIELAGEHLANGELTAATQHARKAIALAGADPTLTRRAWLKMAEILDAEGRTAEADGIRRRYGTLRG